MKSAGLMFSAMLMVNVCLAEQQTDSVPKRFEAEFVGALGASYKIKLAKGTLLCNRSVPGQDTTLKITPTKNQWAEFRQAIDKSGAWHWRTDYRNDGVTDGMYWSLRVEYSDRTVNGSGLNRYPDEKGNPGPDSSYTKAFDAYTKALHKLTGSKFMKD